MVDGKQGLRHWEEAVHIFLSEDREAAFQRALEIGHRADEATMKGGDGWKASCRDRETGLPGRQRDRIPGRTGSKKLPSTCRSNMCLIRRATSRRRHFRGGGASGFFPFLALTPVALRAPSVRAKNGKKRQKQRLVVSRLLANYRD